MRGPPINVVRHIYRHVGLITQSLPFRPCSPQPPAQSTNTVSHVQPPSPTTTMNDASHTSPPHSEPTYYNTASRAPGTRGFTTSELMKTPETSPMLMPVEPTQDGSEDHASECSSWGTFPVQGSTESSPRMFVSWSCSPKTLDTVPVH
jgi:hypothetical protein